MKPLQSHLLANQGSQQAKSALRAPIIRLKVRVLSRIIEMIVADLAYAPVGLPGRYHSVPAHMESAASPAAIAHKLRLSCCFPM